MCSKASDSMEAAFVSKYPATTPGVPLDRGRSLCLNRDFVSSSIRTFSQTITFLDHGPLKTADGNKVQVADDDF